MMVDGDALMWVTGDGSRIITSDELWQPLGFKMYQVLCMEIGGEWVEVSWRLQFQPRTGDAWYRLGVRKQDLPRSWVMLPASRANQGVF